jgi:hypothetical protein
MAAGDVDVQIVNTVASLIDTAVTNQRAAAGANGKFMCAAIGPRCEQLVLIAITEA